ncbi:MAG: glycosyltransferase family 2 protein [bacterium]
MRRHARMHDIGPTPSLAAVLIGRNEGARLVNCLTSVKGAVGRIIYVDSGSTDGSVAAAQEAGAEVVLLDKTQPFTAARARNAGLETLRAGGDLPDYVQFIDGDCELQPGWIETALSFLEDTPKAAIACGRRRERFPEASVYNRLCDREWDTPVGEAKACGGDALMRRVALDQVGGYNPALIAGEEPEMCVRLHAMGWQIWRLDAEMTLHDVNMMQFSQWWNRTRRGGHAAAEGMALHGAGPARLGVDMVRRALFWALILPLVTILLAVFVSPWALCLLLAYPAQTLRLALRHGNTRAAWEQATFLTLGKFAEAAGVGEYCGRRMAGRRAGIIEYK